MRSFFTESKRALLSPRQSAAQRIIASKGTPAFLFGDPNPAKLAPSGLNRLYLESTGITPASASAQTIGLALSDANGAALGAELNVSTSINSGQTITMLAAPTALGRTFRVLAAPVGLQWFDGSTLRNLNGAASSILTVGGTGQFAFFQNTGNPIDISGVSVQEIAGYHAYQATGVNEPSLILENGIWRYRGNGTGKHFLTTLNPASSMTMMAAVNFSADGDVLLGSRDANSNAGVYMVTNGGGKLAARVAAQDPSTITGTSSIIGVAGVAVLRFDPSSVTLKWKPIGGSLETLYGPSAPSGSVQTTVPIMLGAYNANGTAGSFFAGDIYRALVQQSAYTDAEIAAIANQWSQELAAVA